MVRKIDTQFPSQRLNVPSSIFLKVLLGGKWKSLTQIAAAFSDYIAPECAIRFAKPRAKPDGSIELALCAGYRHVASKLGSAAWNKSYVEKKVVGKEVWWKITKKGIIAYEKQAAKARAATP